MWGMSDAWGMSDGASLIRPTFHRDSCTDMEFLCGIKEAMSRVGRISLL